MKSVLTILALTFGVASTSFASDSKFESGLCHSTHKLSSALNFLPGKYEYYLEDGTKLGETEYQVTSGGCAILEKFKNIKGDLSIGLLNLDLKKGKWRHFWTSERFTFEIFGEPSEDGKLLFEGNILTHANGIELPFRGIWVVDTAGNIKHLYEIYDSQNKTWKPFFSDISKKINP